MNVNLRLLFCIFTAIKKTEILRITHLQSNILMTAVHRYLDKSSFGGLLMPNGQYRLRLATQCSGLDPRLRPNLWSRGCPVHLATSHTFCIKWHSEKKYTLKYCDLLWKQIGSEFLILKSTICKWIKNIFF